MCWWPWAEAAGWRRPERPVLMTVTGVEVCGAACILGTLSWAQRALFLSLCCCLVAVTPPRPVGTHSLWGCRVWRGAMVQFRPTYSQYIPSCFEEQTPTGCLLSGQLGLSRQAAKSWPFELIWICQDWVNLHGIQLPQLLQGSRAACRLVHELLERGRLSYA